tara:strand:+ start:41 stop:517 length:477 start_codon:yes stop_codon:yes gene_type:complete
MRRVLITVSLLLSGFLQANIVNLECTYYKSYNWNNSETRKPPSDSLSLRLDKSKKEIEYKGILFPYTQNRNLVTWDVFYPRKELDAKMHLAQKIELNIVTGLLEQNFKTLIVGESIQELLGHDSPRKNLEAADLIMKLKDINSYKLGITHSANCSTDR